MSTRLSELKILVNSYKAEDERRIPYLEEAIIIADKEENVEEMIELRNKLVYSYITNRNTDLIVKLVSDLRLFYDKYYDELDEDDVNRIIESYFRVCQNIEEYYQVSKEKINQLFEDYKSLLIQNSLPLKSYYGIKLGYLKYLNDIDEFKKIYRKYLDLNGKNLYFSCKECEEAWNLEYCLFDDNKEVCNRTIKKYRNKEIKCDSANKGIAAILFSHYISKGDFNNASLEVDHVLEALSEDSFYLYLVGEIILYYGKVGETEKGLNLIEKYISDILKSKQSLNNCSNYVLIWIFLEKLKEENYKKEIRLNLPENICVYSKDNNYDLDTLIEYFKSNGLSLYLKFKKRDGENSLQHLFNIASIALLGKEFEECR